MEAAHEQKRLTADEIVAKVDQAGVLGKEIKQKKGKLDTLDEELKKEAGHQADDGSAVVLEGNVFKATIALSAEFNELEGIELELDPIDPDQGEKLAPWKGEKSHKEFVGGQDDIKEIKKFLDELEGGDALYKKAFHHVKDSRKRTPDKTALGNMARTAVKKHAELKEMVLKFVKAWTPKSIKLTKKTTD